MRRVTDDEDARQIARAVVHVGLQQLKAESFIKWHTYALERCYITTQSQFEFSARLSRGWDTDMTFSVRSHADESGDRLTDRTIDAIRMVVKEELGRLDDEEHHLEENEYVSRLSIRRFEEKSGAPADDEFYSYSVEYKTVTTDGLVVEDEHVGGNPRVAGRRLLVRDVWHRHVRNEADDTNRENPYEDLAEAFDDVITPAEAEALVEYAENRPDQFDSREELLDDDNESFSSL